MLHEFHLNESCDTGMTAEERNVLIRFCISIGTHAKCSTRALLRPFKQKYLTAALREMREKHLRIISECQEKMKNDPTKDFRSQIKQERDMIRRFPKQYCIYLSYPFTDKKWIDFHNSLNPRITFGYSGILHEECDFTLTDEVKSAFENSSLKELPKCEQDWTHDWGNVYFDSITNLCYEDLAVFVDERCILETISHEQCMTVSFTDEELAAFIDFEDKQKENIATFEKLKYFMQDNQN